MGITNIERMVDAIVRDEMNYIRGMSMEDMDTLIEHMIREKVQTFTNAEIVELVTRANEIV